MFFDAERIIAVRQMILAEAKRAQSGPGQIAADAARRFRSNLQGNGRPAGHHPAARSAAARIPAAQGRGNRRRGQGLGTDPEKLRARALALHESNPMLGHRGCRLGITYPEIYEMQAAPSWKRRRMWKTPAASRWSWKSMIPLVAIPDGTGLSGGADQSRRRADQEGKGQGAGLLIGTMIELPRAALRAAEIAETAEFFSFGTNDLTQTTLGVSAMTPDPSWANIFARSDRARPLCFHRADGVGEADSNRHDAEDVRPAQN